jgi:hypothetical protein
MEKKGQGRIFNSTTLPGQLITFAEAFPDIEAVAADITEVGEGNAGLGVRRFYKNSVREYVNCSNGACGGRGLAMGDLLRQMLREKRDAAEFDLACESRQESGHPCLNRFHVRLRIQRSAAR